MHTYFSPAKINRYLRVVSKRADGYHNLSSLFQAIDVCDHLSFELSDADHLTCSDPSLPCDASNLVLKALMLFRNKLKTGPHFKVHLEKHIPQQAGLGGGSSNAATTLWACNEILRSPFSSEELREIGLELGSDVPFFFSSGMAHCTGRGDHVNSYKEEEPTHFTIVKPSWGSSTPKVFSMLGHIPFINENELKTEFLKVMSGHLIPFNHLEEPAFQIEPRLREYKHELDCFGFDSVTLTGSGSAFVCIGINGRIPLDFPGLIFHTKSLQRNQDSWYSGDP